jgi:hypothetical protein
MYEYKTTVVGPLDSLRLSEERVEEAGVGLADTCDKALAHYGRKGWRLHKVVPLASPINCVVPTILFVFEREIVCYPPCVETYTNPHDYQYRGK